MRRKYPKYGIVRWYDISSTEKELDLTRRKNLCLKEVIGRITYNAKEKIVQIECETTLSEGFAPDLNYKIGMPEGCVEEIIPLIPKPL